MANHWKKRDESETWGYFRNSYAGGDSRVWIAAQDGEWNLIEYPDGTGFGDKPKPEWVLSGPFPSLDAAKAAYYIIYGT